MIFVAFAAQGPKLLRVCDKRAETNCFRCIVHPYLPVKLARAVEPPNYFPPKSAARFCRNASMPSCAAGDTTASAITDELKAYAWAKGSGNCRSFV